MDELAATSTVSSPGNIRGDRVSASLPIRAMTDRRRHRRVQVNLLGRFMRPNKQETPCRLIDISVGGASLQAPQVVETGERVIAYFDQIGRIEGTVVRRFDTGFAIEIHASQYKREKLAAQLTWLINRNILNLDEERRHERVAPRNKDISLGLPNGARLSCKIIDVSVGGASVETEARPDLGTEVVLGRLRARIVRHHDQGLGLEFTDIQNPKALRRHFGE